MSYGKNINMKCSIAIILGMAAVVKSAGIEPSHHCKEFHWIVLESASGIISIL